MIQINNLQKKFGAKTAVNIDNYIINQGDMLGLVGNNGAGKTAKPKGRISHGRRILRCGNIYPHR